jgi:alpha-1,6-mannosyltransferase
MVMSIPYCVVDKSMHALLCLFFVRAGRCGHIDATVPSMPVRAWPLTLAGGWCRRRSAGSKLADPPKALQGRVNRMHLVDTTLFFSPTSGGVKRYLMAKHAWLGAHSAWQHSIVVPGPREHIVRGAVCCVRGPRLPGTFNYRLPLNPRHWARVLEHLEPDLIEVGDAFHPAWCGWRVAQRRGIPVTAFYHSNLPQIIGHRLGALSERVIERYIRWLYARVDAVFAPSRVMCDYLRSIGVPHAIYQPLGVDAEIFHPRRRSPHLRAHLGLREDARILVYAGRFAEEKNLPLLLHAFALLGAPYHLLLIGGKRAARPLPNVTLMPYRTDSVELARWIASADALVHAGTRETFGLVILEAMACGRPVVAVRAGAFPELVDESVGLLAEPDRPDRMAEAIAALYERDLEAVGAAARARVLRRFTWARSFQTQIAAYGSLGLVGQRLIDERLKRARQPV